MEDLLIEPTNKTPLVDFSQSGKLVLAGNAYPENAKDFFDPLIDWILELRVSEVIFDIVLEYFNTAAAKKLLELLRKLDASSKIEHLRINWFYDKEDKDALESGQILAETLSRAKFNYVINDK
ncbi:MAG: SiaC family regulatory phosphoprotein [Bacteroidales bacterium]|nr:SiaC family regulatory phosphoprotein [Bacteroidales bacterium]